MKTVVKVLFALIVGIVMFTGVLMLYSGARENARTSTLPAARNDFFFSVIGGADGPTAILVGGDAI